MKRTRPPRRAGSIAAGVGLFVAGGITSCGATGSPARPTVRVTQDAEHVHVFFTNPNKGWRVSNLAYDIDFADDNGAVLASYLQADRRSKDPARAACCLIASLAAGATVQVDLPPVTGTIAHISVSYVGGQWTRT